MQTQTDIFKQTTYGERRLGYLDAAGQLVKLEGRGEVVVGRVENSHIFRLTTHNERELGYYDEQGIVYSYGLFDGGKLGWVESDGVVIRAGLIFGEEEVGRVEGTDLYPAAAALLLLFLPDDAEEEKRLYADR